MADPLMGPRCTRRKQANPRRKNVELEDMPEEVDLDHLGPDDAGAKESVTETTAMTTDSSEKSCATRLCNNSNNKTNDDNTNNGASKDDFHVGPHTGSDKTNVRRTVDTKPSPPSCPSGAHVVPSTHAAVPVLIGGGGGRFPPDEDSKSEEEKIQEYLQRSDTAVIYPEPVDGDPSTTGHASSPAPATGTTVGNKGSLESRTTAKDDFYLKCPHCDKVYSSVESLRLHLVAQHGTAETGISTPINIAADSASGGFACDKCSATFTQKAQLEKHEDLHSPTAQVVACKVCNKTFANVYRLQRHMISHDESAVLRKFKCPECEKAFKFKHHLKEHIRIHSGEKPFACPNCGKRFSHSGSYSSHMTSKKCLVMNLKVRRTIDKPNMRGNGVTSNGGGSSQGGGRRGSSQGAFTPILPKYGENGLELSPTYGTPPGLTVGEHYAAAMDFVPTSMQAFLPPPYGLHPLLASSNHHHHHHHFSNSGLSMYTGLAGPPPPLASLSHMIRPSAIAMKTLEESQDACFAQQRDPAVPPLLPSPHTEVEDNVRTYGAHSPGAIVASGDLKAVKQILATVNATVSKQQQEIGKIRNGLSNQSSTEMERSASTPSPTTSRTQSPLTTTTTAVSSPRSPVINVTGESVIKRNGFRGDDSHCRHCGEFFESKIDLHQHERYLCKMNREIFPTVKREDGTAGVSSEVTHTGADKGSAHASLMNGYSDMDEDAPMSDMDDGGRELNDDSLMLEGDGRKVRMRSLFSEDQQSILRSFYEVNARPAKEELQRIASEIRFPPRVVQVWFQNMRARDKKRGRTLTGRDTSIASVTSCFGAGDGSSPSPQQQQQNHQQQQQQQTASQHAKTPFSAISPTSVYSTGTAMNGSVLATRIPHLPIFYPTPSPSPFSLTATPLRTNGQCTSSSSPPIPPSFVAPPFPLDHEQPLDLSVKGSNKTSHRSNNNNSSSNNNNLCHSPAASDHSASDGEALNLSQKSSRTSTPSKESNNNNNNNYALVTTSSALNTISTQFNNHHLHHHHLQHHPDHHALLKAAETSTIFKYMMATPKMELEDLSAGEETPDLVVMRRSFSGSPTTCDTPRLHRILASSPHLDVSCINGTVDSSGRVYSTDGSHSPCPSDHDDQLEIDEGSDHQRRCWKQMEHGEESQLDMDDSSMGEDDRPLKRRKSWKQHKLEAEEGMYACDQCDKMFSKQSSLARHKYEHSGQRPHKCDVCAKAFKHKHHLTEHKRLHSGEKPFQCKKCFKRFSHSGSYSQHMNHRYSYCKPYRE